MRQCHRVIVILIGSQLSIERCRCQPGHAAPIAGVLGAKELDILGVDLTDPNDAHKAHRAIWKLVAAHQQSVPFLRERLWPVPDVSPRCIDQLIADLDSAQFATRPKAMVDLEKLGPAARAPLEKALAGEASLEVRRRLEQVLEKANKFTLSAEELQIWRALEVLEHVGTVEARQVLQKLAQGAAGVRQTEEAKRILERLARRSAASPSAAHGD
jgi:hypothetical protein